MSCIMLHTLFFNVISRLMVLNLPWLSSFLNAVTLYIAPNFEETPNHKIVSTKTL